MPQSIQVCLSFDGTPSPAAHPTDGLWTPASLSSQNPTGKLLTTSLWADNILFHFIFKFIYLLLMELIFGYPKYDHLRAPTIKLYIVHHYSSCSSLPSLLLPSLPLLGASVLQSVYKGCFSSLIWKISPLKSDFKIFFKVFFIIIFNM